MYVSDDEEEYKDNITHNHRVRRSKRVQQNLRLHEHDKLIRSVNLVEHDIPTIPDLTINVQQKLSRGLWQANKIPKLGKWAHAMYFAGAIVDDETGKALEYCDLIKIDKY